MWVASVHCQMYVTFALYFAAVSGLCLLSLRKAYVELRGTFVLIFYNQSTVSFCLAKNIFFSNQFIVKNSILFPQDSSSPFLVGGLKLISNLQHILLPTEWFPCLCNDSIVTKNIPSVSLLSRFIGLFYNISLLAYSLYHHYHSVTMWFQTKRARSGVAMKTYTHLTPLPHFTSRTRFTHWMYLSYPDCPAVWDQC